MIADPRTHRRDGSSVAAFSRSAAYCARYFSLLTESDAGKQEPDILFVIADLNATATGVPAISTFAWTPDVDVDDWRQRLPDSDSLESSAETALETMRTGRFVGAPLFSRDGLTLETVFPSFEIHLREVTGGKLTPETFLATARSSSPITRSSLVADYEFGVCMRAVRRRLASNLASRRCGFCGSEERCRRFCSGCATAYCDAACMYSDSDAHARDCVSLYSYFESKTSEGMTAAFFRRTSKNG